MKLGYGLTAAIIALSPSIATAQAFGIEMGAPVSGMDVVEDLGDFNFLINPPRTVSGFETYSVYATPESGVCVARGVGKPFERDGYGIRVRDQFQDLKSLLDEKYGTGVLHEGLRTGALWDEIDEWIMAILQNERYYQAEWNVNDPEGINDIIMSVQSLSMDSASILLQYRFSNFEECRREARAENAGGL